MQSERSSKPCAWGHVPIVQGPPVHSAGNPACLEVAGDGPVMTPESGGEISQVSPGPVAVHHGVDLGIARPTLDPVRPRV
jgi:hypothetical protein